jgi:two-component system chemotaxis response regulator CheB
MSALVVIGSSAGGLKPLRRIIAALPVPCAASVFVVQHIGNRPSELPLLLDRPGLHAIFAEDETRIEPGYIYVAPPDHHMVLTPGCIRLNRGAKVHFTRPAADPLFVSAAETYGERVVGIVLSGGLRDGAAGLLAIKEHGGVTIVQHPDEAAYASMPHAAIVTAHPNACLLVKEIAGRLAAFCSGG